MHQSDDQIEKKYETAFVQASGGNPIFPFLAKQQMGKMIDIIAESNDNISRRLSTGQKPQIKGGFIAEEVFAETFNLDAALNDSELRAITDRFPEWKDYGLKGNGIPDVAIVDRTSVVETAQSKFEQSVNKTAGKMSQINADGTPKYEEVGVLLGPKDQVNPTNPDTESIPAFAQRIAEEKAKAGDNPALVESHAQTAKKTTSKLEHEGISSTEITKAEADKMGSGDLRNLKKTENQYQTRSTIQQMGKAATGAAAMSAIVCGTVNSIRYINLARDGKLSADQAAFAIVKETVCSAADSAIKASANVGVQSLMVRYGAEKIVVGTLAKQGLGAMMRTNAVTVGVVCAVDAVKDIVHLGLGNITKEQFYDRQGKNILNTSAGVLGGSLGAGAAGGIVASMGVTGAAGNVLMLAGGLSGGLIAGIAMTMAIENGIEKPYRDLVNNTGYLKEAAEELDRVSHTVFMGQILFSKYLEEGLHLEQQLQAQTKKIEQAGEDALNAIIKI